MLKLELISDVNRIITHRSSGGVMKYCAKGCCVDARKFRCYGFVDKGSEELYSVIGKSPLVRFYLSYDTGEIWMTCPDVDTSMIVCGELKGVVISLQRDASIPRVHILAKEYRYPEAKSFMAVLDRYIDTVKDAALSTPEWSYDRAVAVMLLDFRECYGIMMERVGSDNENKTGDYGYNKKGNCLYRKPGFKSKAKRDRGIFQDRAERG